MNKIVYGRAYCAKYHGCESLNGKNSDIIGEILARAAKKVGATVVETCSHDFQPHGASSVLILKESHYGVHTWPELNTVCATFHSSGKVDSYEAVIAFGVEIGAKKITGAICDFDTDEIIPLP